MAAKTGKRIGLMGGSFNPPHEGHLQAAEAAFRALKLDELWLLVTPQNPLKDPKNYAPLADRMEMCRLMAGNRAWLIPSDIEKSFNSNKTAYNLKKLQALHPQHQFVWIMGADNLRDFHLWENWQSIIDTWPIAVMHRQGEKKAALESPAAKYAARLKTDDAGKLGSGGRPGWCFIDSPNSGLKSRAVVERVKNGPIALKSLFNELAKDHHGPEFQAVARYILDKGLYGAKASKGPGPSQAP
jgi:nicotinate-nucleotide adenylyltransferase